MFSLFLASIFCCIWLFCCIFACCTFFFYFLSFLSRTRNGTKNESKTLSNSALGAVLAPTASLPNHSLDRSELESYLTLQVHAALAAFSLELFSFVALVVQASLEDKKLASKSRTNVDNDVENRRLYVNHNLISCKRV